MGNGNTNNNFIYCGVFYENLYKLSKIDRQNPSRKVAF